MVSIPNRDFDELQFQEKSVLKFFLEVSIPNRDFDELQFLGAIVPEPNTGFQSLIGILMNCNPTGFFVIE
ncbi:hypothetical protein GXM_06003 [Nostoc sphaeroides CCNUC1]|uniref:Uncharacterized protein n=1 Tax=Nostoc sphaeroides CCNUC1 TaxID=2653204 RepID=A0A5P8W968_9NOSO|nr:hypothetical protein GXM_06003 [Nostoc sphaeroides CCNUC1]